MRVTTIMATVAAGILVVGLGATSASAAESAESKAIDIPPGDVHSTTVNADERAVLVTGDPLGTFPREGDDYLILSTGLAEQVVGGDPGEFASTELGVGGGADGNDLTQVAFSLTPPATANCLAFDFQFLSEEYPEYIGSDYNDIFTAEMGESLFFMEGPQVIAPNNFAYDAQGNFISVNTVLGFADADGTWMDGTTEPLGAVAPLERDLETGRVNIFLSVQDIGDSIYDSAVLIDNFRWLYGENCERTVDTLTDSDGDGLPDDWEESGIDYDGDGTPEVDLAALGADPAHADIFLEIDWMVREPTCLAILCWGGLSFAPQSAALQDVVDAFAAAPYANPDGVDGITVHIDAGGFSPGASLGGGNSVPWVDDLGTTSASGWYDWTDFEAIKAANFDPLRRDVFHYVLYADSYGGSGSSGISRGIPGADLIVSDGPWGAGGFTRIQERGTLMHELGHNLDLMHGGIDHSTYQWDPVFKSVMNYLYQLSGITPGAGLDYSRGTPVNEWDRIRFDGGSIGDLGDSAPIEETFDDEEFSPEIAEEYDALAVAGDGAVTFLGPNVFAAGEPSQHLVATVENPGGESADYILAAIIGGEAVATAPVSVDAGGSTVVDLVFDAGPLGVGATSLALVLESEDLGGEVDRDLAEIEGIDLDDPGVVADLESDLESAVGDLDPEVLGAVSEILDPTLTFNDVSDDKASPFYSAFFTEISWLAAQGISRGWEVGGGEREYRPFRSITRDAMAAFLYRFAGEPEFDAPTESPFVDVSPGATQFYEEITWLASTGVTTGWDVGGGQKEFRPFAPITRDAMAAFLYRFGEISSWTAPTESPFIDVTDDTSQFYPEITWLESTGITTGWDVGGGMKEYRPYNDVTRDAMAAFLYRFKHLPG